jgi:hypothetical protein
MDNFVKWLVVLLFVREWQYTTAQIFPVFIYFSAENTGILGFTEITA